ncbi:MAG TPA: glycogen debranching N-terminal domain-containing protein, partial [Acidimicrobiales bacterium]|nr:glycogen debranching N-terminal domain-containing protein [Acidimicrobiales bacterium]
MGIRVSPPGTLVTLVEAGSFCVSLPSGDIVDADEGGAAGLFVADRRLLSRFLLTVNGAPLVPVDHRVDGPASATFVGRAVAAEHPDGAAHTAGPGGPVVVRRRT